VRPRRRSSSTALLFALLALLVGFFAAGCGGGGAGGDDQSESRRQGAGEAGQRGKEGETTRQGEGRPQLKIAPGTVESVDPEAGTLVLRVTQGESMTFAILPRTEVKLDGEAAELADVREGQSAQVSYVVQEGENRARLVSAIGGGQ
jgi:hypothetical protein